MKVKSESEVAPSCPSLCDPMDCSLPGFSVHGIFQASVLEWGAINVTQKDDTVFYCSKFGKLPLNKCYLTSLLEMLSTISKGKIKSDS